MGSKIEEICVICGKSFSRSPTNTVKSKLKVTCTHGCFIIYKKYKRDQDKLFFDDERRSWTKLSLEEYTKEELRLYD